MNSTIYVFGHFNEGYMQYPDDYTESICQKFCEVATAKTQLVIHRDKELVYYGYVRRLDTPCDTSQQCIGFCIVLNGVMLIQEDALFALFEHAISHLVQRGELLSLNSNGGVCAPSDSLVDKNQEVTDAVEAIRTDFAAMEVEVRQLPPPDISMAKQDDDIVVSSEGQADMGAFLVTNGYMLIPKEQNSDPVLPVVQQEETVVNYKTELALEKLCVFVVIVLDFIVFHTLGAKL